MAYSSDITHLLSEQLDRFSKLKPHQLAGHVANLDFWLGEVAHRLKVIDGYEARLENMRGAQQRYVLANEVVEPNRFEPERKGPPRLPRHVPAAELGGARRALCNAVHRFLMRCFDERLITSAEFDDAHRRLGIDPAELRRL